MGLQRIFVRTASMIALVGAFWFQESVALAAQEVRVTAISRKKIQVDGKELFRKHCALCHGGQGKGGMGVPLNLQSFLVVADKFYLIRSMINGRPTRGMPSYAKILKSEELETIALFVKSWQRQPNLPLPRELVEGDANKGKILYRRNCVICHGVDAEGGKLPPDGHDIDQTNQYMPVGGPALADPGFLKSASNSFLKATIMYGRTKTRMDAYAKDRQGFAELTDNEIDDIVAYIRDFERQ